MYTAIAIWWICGLISTIIINAYIIDGCKQLITCLEKLDIVKKVFIFTVWLTGNGMLIYLGVLSLIMIFLVLFGVLLREIILWLNDFIKSR